MEIVVVQGKNKYPVTCESEGTFKAMKERIQEVTGVSPPAQKLIFKGKERKDGESVSASGIKSGDKVMLMLSEAGHKELKAQEEKEARQKRAQEAADAQKLKENHRDGGGEGGVGPASAGPSVTIVNEEGAEAEGASLVTVSRGKTRFRLVLEEGLTFGGLKKKLERISRVAEKEQRLIFKGKERGSEEDLAGVGVKAGAKMLLMCGEGQHIQEDATEVVKNVEEELEQVEGRARKVEAQCAHGMLDTVAASFALAVCFEGVERMQDNLLYVGPTHPLAPTVAALQARLTTLHATLSELQLKYVVSANRR